MTCESKTSEAQKRAVARYQKKRLETDEEYRRKKNEASKLSKRNRYQNDPEFRERKKAESRNRNAMLREFYKRAQGCY